MLLTAQRVEETDRKYPETWLFRTNYTNLTAGEKSRNFMELHNGYDGTVKMSEA